MMVKPYELRTPKQKQLSVRNKLLSSFRRYVSLEANGGSVLDYLDMNAHELREYLEGQWLPGMTWDNYRSEWCVDHIVALKYFNVFNRREMALCWSYNNMKPKWISDNHAKGYCIEVTIRELNKMPKNAVNTLLTRHVSNYIEMFHPYYKTT